MNIDSPNFIDGRIKETIVREDSLGIRILSKKTQSGELVVELHSQPNGGLYLHFSGLLDLPLKINQNASNGMEIRW